MGGKFKLGRKIGCGSFGELYLGTCLMLWFNHISILHDLIEVRVFFFDFVLMQV